MQSLCSFMTIRESRGRPSCTHVSRDSARRRGPAALGAVGAAYSFMPQGVVVLPKEVLGVVLVRWGRSGDLV